MNFYTVQFSKAQAKYTMAYSPPEIMVTVKALACHLRKQLSLPFSKFTHDEIVQQAQRQGGVASTSGKIVWRCYPPDRWASWPC